MKVFIKNMVCARCVSAVTSLFQKHGLKPDEVTLGEVDLPGDTLSEKTARDISEELKQLGFELINDHKTRLIERIKNLVVDYIHYSKEHLKVNFSVYLSDKMNYEYTYLSNLFSEVEGTTIEKYLISQRIEKVKELLVYDELTLSEIAYRMGYSSVAHLSGQFKKITGLTPSFYKTVKENKRKKIEEV